MRPLRICAVFYVFCLVGITLETGLLSICHKIVKIEENPVTSSSDSVKYRIAEFSDVVSKPGQTDDTDDSDDIMPHWLVDFKGCGPDPDRYFQVDMGARVYTRPIRASNAAKYPERNLIKFKIISPGFGQFSAIQFICISEGCEHFLPVGRVILCPFVTCPIYNGEEVTVMVQSYPERFPFPNYEAPMYPVKIRLLFYLSKDIVTVSPPEAEYEVVLCGEAKFHIGR